MSEVVFDDLVCNPETSAVSMIVHDTIAVTTTMADGWHAFELVQSMPLAGGGARGGRCSLMVDGWQVLALGSPDDWQSSVEAPALAPT